MTNENETFPQRIVKKAQGEFLEKPIQTTTVLIGMIGGLTLVAGSAWAVRSVLTFYVLPMLLFVVL